MDKQLRSVTRLPQKFHIQLANNQGKEFITLWCAINAKEAIYVSLNNQPNIHTFQAFVAWKYCDTQTSIPKSSQVVFQYSF